MAEIPEHLLKRAQEAKARATTGGDSSPTEATASESKIPEELLNRTAAAGSQPSAVATKDVSEEIASPQPPPASATGPAGHTQSLLAVVKSGSTATSAKAFSNSGDPGSHLPLSANCLHNT